MTNRYIDLIEKKANSLEKEATFVPKTKKDVYRLMAPIKKTLGESHKAVKNVQSDLMNHIAGVRDGK